MRHHAIRSILIQLSATSALCPQRRSVPGARLLAGFLILVLCLGYYCGSNLPALAHFADRPDLNGWAAKLKSSAGGLCCSFADAEALTDVQWDTKDGHYRVFLDGEWIEVPDNSVVNVPNLYGSAVVWPLRDRTAGGNKVYGIRCFLPGGGT